MLKPQIQTNPEVYWGLGFGIETSDNRKGIWHWGDGGYFTICFYGNIDKKSAFVFFANSHYGLAVLNSMFALLSEGEHLALSFTVGDWSFSDDYLSPAMEFKCKYFNGQTDEALALHRDVARSDKKSIRFIADARLEHWTVDFLRKNKIIDAIIISQLLIDAYYPERSDTCTILAHEYYETKTNDAAIEYLEAASEIIDDIQFAWVVDRAIAGLRPVILAKEILLSYKGIYDPYEISIENSIIVFQT